MVLRKRIGEIVDEIGYDGWSKQEGDYAEEVLLAFVEEHETNARDRTLDELEEEFRVEYGKVPYVEAEILARLRKRKA